MAEKLIEIFSENLKKYLDINGYTQADMARHMGVSSATASDWCNGKKMPRSDKLQKLCSWFSIELSDLLTDKSSENEDYYYLNPETAKVAQEIFDDRNLRALFDAARDSKPEDLKMAAEMLRKFKATNPDG